MSELKPCPFCNKTDKVRFYTESMAQHGILLWIRYGVRCNRCHFEIPTYAKKATAIRKWNTRPSEDALSARNKELAETVRGLEKTIGRAEKVLGERNLLAAEVERLKEDDQVYRDMLNSLLNEEVYHLDNATMTNIKYELDNRGSV